MWCSAVGAIITLILSLLAVPPIATAQPQGKVYRIGFLGTNPLPAAWWDAFLDGLRERGYSEGQNLVFERPVLGRESRALPGGRRRIGPARSDCIIVPRTPAALAAKHATQTIPIVFPTAIDPVGAGLVASLAQPAATSRG